MAFDQKVDLVEIAPNADPPVARLIEFKKYKYLLSKREKGTKKPKGGDIKEIRVRPFTGDHDLETRLNRAKEWLEENNKVKVVVKFQGREIAKPDFGFKMIAKILNALKEDTEIERPAHFEGKQLVVTIKPKK